MAKTNIGVAYISIMPSTEGFIKELYKDTKGAGEKGGKEYGDGFGDGAKGPLDSVKTLLGGAAAAVGGAFVAAASASTAAIGSIVQQSFAAYASYEQLVGGVETLFGAGGAKNLEEYAAAVGRSVDEVRGEFINLNSAQAAVIDAANGAWKTAGLSANDYMETVTSFSASLISSLGGDTQKAAGYADRAITDMADNANKMGTSIGSIQDAYQGFAKQNYTMLDNLKLGYGGTQAEMQRLIADAAKMTDVQEQLGITVDASSMSFSNIVDAISVVQTSLGITGTTAKEAASTIEGSVNSMKAAWENFVTHLASGNEEYFAEAAEALGESVTNVLTNIVSTAGRLLPNILEWVPVAFAEVIGRIKSDVLPQLDELTGGIATPLVEGFEKLVTAAFELVGALAPIVADLLPPLAAALGFVAENINLLLPLFIALGGAFIGLQAYDFISGIIGAGAEAAGAMATQSAAAVPQILAFGAAGLMLGAAVLAAGAGVALLVQSAIQLGTAGPQAAIGLVALVAVVALFAGGMALLGPALTASTVGIVAFGAAVLLVGAGIALACAGITLLVTQLPMLAEYGASAGLAAAQLALGVAALGLGALVAAPGITLLGVALAAAALGMAACALAVVTLGAGLLVSGAGAVVLGAGLSLIAASGASAAVGLAACAVSVTLFAAGATLAGVGSAAFAVGIAAAGIAAVAATVGIAACAAAMGLLAAAVTLASAGCVVVGTSLLAMALALPVVAALCAPAAVAIGVLAAGATAAAAGLALATPGFVAFAAGATAASAGVLLTAAGIMACTTGAMALTLAVTLATSAMAALSAVLPGTAASCTAAAPALMAMGAASMAAGSSVAMAAPMFVALATACIAGAAGAQQAASSMTTMAAGAATANAAVMTATAATSQMTSTFARAQSQTRSLGSSFSSVAGPIANAANQIASQSSRIGRAMDDIANKVRSSAQSISNAFSGMRMHIPSPTLGPLPHFSMSGKFNPETGEVPKINVNWYAKGGIFNAPSIIGVGERGPEAVVPLDKLGGIVRDAMDRDERPVVNQYFTNKVVRADADISSAYQMLFRSEMSAAREVF